MLYFSKLRFHEFCSALADNKISITRDTLLQATINFIHLINITWHKKCSPYIRCTFPLESYTINNIPCKLWKGFTWNYSNFSLLPNLQSILIQFQSLKRFGGLMNCGRVESRFSECYNLTYIFLVNGLCKCGKFNEIWKTWDRRSKRKHDPVTCSSLIHELMSKAGNLDREGNVCCL